MLPIVVAAATRSIRARIRCRLSKADTSGKCFTVGRVISLNLAPALRLLAHWSPTRAPVVLRGELPPPDERTWAEPPDPAEFAALFPGRVPLAVEVLNHRLDPDDEFADARPRPEVTAEVWALLLAAHPDDLPEPARELLGQLAFEFAEAGELARVTLAAEPDELHLVSLDYNGAALVLSPTTPDTTERDPVAVLTDIADVLGEYVWLSNNDRLRVDATAEPHGLGALTDASFREWWPSSRTAASLRGRLWDDEPEPAPLDAEELAAFVTSFTADNLANARSGAWAAELIEDEALDDPRSRFPGDRLVELFTAELFDRAATLAGSPALVYGMGLPADEEVAEYGLMGAIVFAGAERVVTLGVDTGV